MAPASVLRILVCTLLLAVAAWVFAAAPAHGLQDDPPTGTQIEDADQPAGGIIPRPNSGNAPTDAAERGGALQLLLLGLIVVFGCVAVWSVRRSGQKAKLSRTTEP